MSVLVYTLVGWVGMALWTALGAHLAPGHVVPDAAIVTLVFVALRREPIPVIVNALVLGYLAGRQALAPLGLHESVLVVSAIVVYMTGGSLAGSGARFYALASGGTVMLYHLLLFLFGRIFGGAESFSGLATALLLPSGLATAALALVSHPLLTALERRLTAERREELSWR